MILRVVVFLVVVIVVLLLAVFGGMVALDVLRAARFLAGARRLAPASLDEEDVTTRSLDKKLTPEEEAAHREALWAQLYRPGLSRARLNAFRQLREQNAFFLDDWMWRLWWRAWCRLAAEATGGLRAEALSLAQREGRGRLHRLPAADLDLLLALLPADEAPSSELSWAQSGLLVWHRRGEALRRLDALAGRADHVGRDALVTLVNDLVERRDEDAAVARFAQLLDRHPQARGAAEPGLLGLLSPGLDLFRLGSRRVVLCRRASGASFRLAPLRFDPSPEAASGWLRSPPGVQAGRPGEAQSQGELDLHALPLGFSFGSFLLPASLRGAFLLEVRARPAPSALCAKLLPDLALREAESHDFLQHTQIDAVLSLTESGVALWVLDRETRAPCADLPVQFWLLGAQGQKIEEHRRRTDRDGLAALSGVAFWQIGASVQRQGSHGATEFLFLTHGGDISTASASTPEERLYLWLARPLYRPGETVQGKLVARTRRPVGPSVRWAAGRRATILVRDPRGNTLTTMSLSLSRFGSASFTIPLPAGAPLGRYTFSLQERHERLRLEGSFQVEEFVAPEFRADLRALEAPRWGEALPLQFEASYFFGGAVAGAAGTVEIRRRSWSYVESPEWPPERRFSGEKVLEPLSFQTDAGGQAKLTLPWLGPLDLLRLRDGCDLDLKAVLRDASGKTCEASLSLSFGRQAHVVEVTPQHMLRLPGEPLPLRLRWHPAPPPEPAAYDLTVTMRRGLVRRRRTLRVSTGDREIELPQGLSAGEWRLTARIGGQRRPLQYPRSVWILGDQSDSTDPQLVVSRHDLGPGEPARVALFRPRSPFPMSVLLVYNRGDLLQSRVLSSPGDVVWTELFPPPGATSKLHVQAWFVAPARGFLVQVQRQVLTVPTERPEPPPALSLSLSFPAPALAPGSEATLSASVEEADAGQGELVCSVVDEAIFSLVPAPRAPLAFFEEPPAGQDDGKAAWSEAWASAQAGRYVAPRRQWSPDDDLPKSMLVPQAAPSALMMPSFGAPLAGAPSRAMPEFEMAEMAAMAPRSAGLPMPRLSRGSLRLRKSKSADEEEEEAREDDDGSGGAPTVEEASVALRSDFSSEAAWYPEVAVAGGQGVRLAVRLPDTLTTWKASALLITLDERLGEAEARVRTQKPLMVRLQAPRFFQERDVFPLRALVDSRGGQEQQVRASLEAPGLSLRAAAAFSFSLAAGGQEKIEVEALVLAGASREISVRAEARGALGDADMEERRVPFRSYGVMRRQTAQGVLEDGKESVSLVLPEQRKKERTRLLVKVDRGPLDTVIHALSYLREYPYGCVEQTCSRLIPNLVWERVVGGAKPGQEGYREAPPAGPLDEAVEAGLKQLLAAQNGDGGFGWWAGRGSDVWMTAYVLFSFSIASRPDDASLRSASQFLRANLLNATNPDDADAFAAFALAWRGEAVEGRVFDVLLPRWDALSLTEQAKLCLPLRAARHPEASARVASVRRRLVRSARRFLRKIDADDAGGWFEPRATEAIAFFVLVLLREPPSTGDAEPEETHDEALGLLVSFLLLHRSGTRWHSTRDTALAVLALLSCEERTSQGVKEAFLRVFLGGKEMLAAPLGGLERSAPALALGDDELRSGENRLDLSAEGLAAGSPVQRRYYSVELEYCSQQDEIPAVEEGLRVERAYWLLDDRQEPSRRLGSGERVAVGQRLRVVLRVKADKPRRYLLLVDPKLAGCEPLAKKSGPEACKGRCEHVELRADHTAIFLGWLGDQAEEISLDIEAQIPGTFTAMPASAETMYDSKCSGASGSFSLTIDAR